jgi:hypothetical protein
MPVWLMAVSFFVLSKKVTGDTPNPAAELKNYLKNVFIRVQESPAGGQPSLTLP